MGNVPSGERSLASAVVENSRAGKKRIDRLLGTPVGRFTIGPRGDSLLLKHAGPGAKRLGVFFVMNGRVKHIDDITYEKGGHLFLDDEIRVAGCVFSDGLHRSAVGSALGSALLVRLEA